MAREIIEVIIPADLDGLPDGSTRFAAIEASATADQTGAEIKTAYEAQANAYSDTKDTKLTGIEDSATADQTGIEVQSLVTGLADADRVLIGSEPLSGEKKIYGIHRNAAGSLELDSEDTAEV
ncbi:hypothetical protein LCGC14_2421180 [marine sediment metagenome]|uniref:Uncharacterized protein n=1 Tax=marine sediment metagenome TaxID=412755 RepID=A0A0F9EIX7_9ZZZZ